MIPAPHKKPKQKTCRNTECRSKFIPSRPMQTWCQPECGLAIARAKQAKQKRESDKAERAKTKAAKEKLKPRSAHMREAQQAFNEFIRWRDRIAGHPCISSGAPLDWMGNDVDAGHYRSVGSAPHLRFCELNCHAQRKHDNRFKSGNAVDYRLGLIERIGLEAVERLEADQEPRKYTIPELQAIKAEYRAKTRELKRKAG